MIQANKDITTVEAPAIIIHGVNCQRAMNSGVAKALFTKWPIVKEQYMSFSQDEMSLGKVDSIKLTDELYVVNCWTQENYGYDNQRFASAKAIEICLEKVSNICDDLKIYEVFAPRIGCGLGGLSWEEEVFLIFQKIEIQNPKINFTICNLHQTEAK